MNRTEKLSEHFTLGELIRSDTGDRLGIDNMPPIALIPKLERLCTEILEPIRIYFGKPFRPNSGYRSPAINKAVGSSAASQHCKAEAVDIEIPGISNYELATWIRDNLKFDQLILECYRPGEPNSGWVHVSLKEDDPYNRLEVLTYSNKQYTKGFNV